MNDLMPELIPEVLSVTSVSVFEPNVEIKEDLNPPVPLKRTLIRTAGG